MQRLRMARYMYSRFRVRLSLDSQYQFRVSRRGGEGGREGGRGVNDAFILEGDTVDAEVENGPVHVFEVAGAFVAGFPVPV